MEFGTKLIFQRRTENSKSLSPKSDSRRAEVIAPFLTRVFAPACPWIPPVQDKTEFQVLILRKLLTRYLSRSRMQEAKPRDEKKPCRNEKF